MPIGCYGELHWYEIEIDFETFEMLRRDRLIRFPRSRGIRYRVSTEAIPPSRGRCVVILPNGREWVIDG